MKFKSSKKFISLFLAVLMIVSSVPAFAISASAATNTTVGYTSGVISGGTTSRAKNGYFNITNDGTNDSTTAAIWNYDISNIDTSNGVSAAVTYSIGDKANYWYEPTIPNLAIDFYFVNPSLISSYVDSTGTKQSESSALQTDDRHQSLVTTFGLTDSNKLGSIDHNFTDSSSVTFTDNLSNAITTSKSNGWASLAVMAIVSRNHSNSENTYSDAWFKSSNLDYYENCTTADLKTAMNAYEAKMDGTLYYNMADAYQAYVNANKAYDACYYGGSTNISLNSVYGNLVRTTAALQPYSEPTFNATAYYISNVATGGYSSLVYAPGAAAKNYSDNIYYHGNSNSPDAASKIGLTSDLVVAYDGSDAYIPIAMEMWTGSTARAFASYVQTTGLTNNDSSSGYSVSFKQNWRRVTGGNDSTWSEPNTDLTLPVDNSTKTDNQINSEAMFFNKLFVTSNNTTDYYNKINYSNIVVSTAGHYKYQYWSMFSYKDADDSYSGNNNTVSGQAYVINFKPIKDKINTLKSLVQNYSKNVTSYRNNELTSFYKYLDVFTQVNPNNYNYSSGVESAVQSCANAIKSAMNTANYTAPSTDNAWANYSSLRTALDNLTNASTAKTASSLVAYGKAISDARNAFVSIISCGYSTDSTPQSLATAIETAKNALVNVDSDSAYDNFDAAVAVVSAMDKDAFKDANEVQTKIDEAKAQVYTTLSGDDATYYQLATGQAPTAPLKNSAAVDTVTKGLLEFASNPGDENIKSFSVKLGATVFNKGSETNLEEKDLGTKKYGDIIEVNVNDEFAEVNSIADKSISWSVQYKDYSGNTISTQKVYNDEPTIKVKATANIVITAFVTNDTKTEESAGYTVKFLDIYGKLADVAYTSEKPVSGVIEGETYTVGSKTYSPVIPFYTIAGFNVSAPDANNVVTVRPTYTTEIRLGITVINGSASSSSLKGDGSVQKTKTVTVSTDVPHIGWAVKNGDKYQIVAYTKGDYDFVALGDNSVIYTPIISMDDGYAVYADDASTIKLTASNVDGFANNSMVSTDKVSDDVYLNAKIANKAPFTYVEDYTTVQVDGTTMYRYYVRVTAGSDSSINSFGVEASGKKYAIVSKNDTTGQYSATFRSPKSNFSAYVSYNFSYNYGGENYNISTTDSVQYNA